MRLTALAATLLLFALVPATPASAQGSDLDLSVLYIHTDDTDLWMDPVEAPEEDTGGHLLDSSEQFGPPSMGLQIPLQPALAQQLQFVSGQAIQATIVIGAAYLNPGVPAGVPVTPAGPVTVTVTLAAGATAVGSGSAEGMMPDGTVAESTTFAITITPSATGLDGSANLVMTLDIDTQVPGPFFLDTAGASHLDLPLLAPPPVGAGEVVFLSADDAQVSSQAGETATLGLALNGTEGAAFTLSADGLPDGVEATLDPASGTLGAGPAEAELSLGIGAAVEPGSYPFTVMAATAGGANATLALTLVVQEEPPATPPSPPGSPPSPPSSPPSEPDDNETDGSGGDKGSPGLAPVALSAALLAAAVVARRRRL